ncbi:probable RNA-directed DNA polymerase from transposon X-element [Trichonephila clavipes]|nr:probable RNA-directed DNA polymerase from transposon X-element [Trichonephila clavipes]
MQLVDSSANPSPNIIKLREALKTIPPASVEAEIAFSEAGLFPLNVQKAHRLSEKFWGRISLAISLVGRRSPLSLENKVILYKQILRPVITYGSPVWGAAAATHMKKIQVMQNKILRVMTNAPWYVRNDVIHNDLQMEPIANYITKLSRNVFKSIESHDNPIIKAQTVFTYPHPKIKYAYSSTKWRNPLRPP